MRLEAPPKTSLEATDWEVVRMAVGDEHQARHNKTTDRNGAKWTSAADLVEEVFPPADWLVQGLASKRGITIIGGDPKASKTFCLLDTAIAVAGAGRVFGEFQSAVPPSDVILFLTEDTRRSVRNRLVSICEGHAIRGDARKAILGRIQVRIMETFDLRDTSSLLNFIADVRHKVPTPALIGLDPLRNLHGGEENSSSDMGTVMAAARDIQALCDCAVIITHHSSKSGGADDRRSAGARMRGSSAIDGARDGLISLENTEKAEDGSSITNDVIVSLKAHRGAGAFRVKLEIEDNEHGEAIRATWEHSKPGKSEKPGKRSAEDREAEKQAKREAEDKAANDRCHKTIMRFLRKLGPDGCSMRALRDTVAPQVHIRRDAVEAVVHKMAEAGFVSVVFAESGRSKVTIGTGFENEPE